VRLRLLGFLLLFASAALAWDLAAGVSAWRAVRAEVSRAQKLPSGEERLLWGKRAREELERLETRLPSSFDDLRLTAYLEAQARASGAEVKRLRFGEARRAGELLERPVEILLWGPLRSHLAFVSALSRWPVAFRYQELSWEGVLSPETVSTPFAGRYRILLYAHPRS